MNEIQLQLLVDLHRTAQRQGPGGEAETLKSIDLAMLDPTELLKIADIGCGTGASAMLLVRELNAQVTAVDFLPGFIDVLKDKAESEGLLDKISPIVGSMDNLPFNDEEYDVIWSEGAIYNIGFEKGVREWRRYLKSGGFLIVSEITWITAERPSEIQKYWESEYPEIGTASSKINILETSGYTPVAYFTLPEHCWLENYYRPIQNRFSAFLAGNAHSEDAQTIVEAEKREISLYEKYKNYFSYGVYIAKKLV
ncbi:MAG: class I SAM-dependent methyltransferase [Desulfuromusa sp.]|nr:class I SAM-dependent methyltransferase [Desulfuromusa sp.]